MDELVISVREGERQLVISKEEEQQLVEACDTETGFINATEAHLAKLNAQLVSCRRILEERRATVERNNSREEHRGACTVNSSILNIDLKYT
ncbi:hypothetical protein ACLOJK_027299 [Asimina triloba]